MSLLTLPETSNGSTTLLRKPDALRLSVDAGETVRIMPLPDGKTTIGSSPQCSIVLPSADSRPLQCVVAVDDRRVEATRWGAGAQLNRRDFSKSIVTVGDKLTIGRCELEFAVSEELDERIDVAETAAESTRPAKTLAPGQAPQAEQTKTEATQATKAASTVASAASATSAKLEPLDEDPAEPAAIPMTALAVIPQTPQPLTSRPTLVVDSTPQEFATRDEPASLADSISAPQTALACSSHAFADELILQLWQVGDRSRRRAKALVAATRDARLRTNAMAADLAAMEVELDLARAAYDSHAADHEQLHLELIQRDRRSAERIGPLTDEIDALRSQLQETQIELAEQAARCDELNAALETHQSNSVASTNAQAAETARAAELEQSLSVQIEQATLLAHELGAIRTELEGVKSELERQAARRQELETELASVQSERDSFKRRADEAAIQEATIAQLRGDVERLHSERADVVGKLSDAESEVGRLGELFRTANERVAELEQALATRESSTNQSEANEQNALEPSTSIALGESMSEPTSLDAVNETTWNASHEATAELVESPNDASHETLLQAWTPADEHEQAAPAIVEGSFPAPSAAESSQSYEAPADFAPSAPVATVPVASELAPTSFIDKYRHLLDDDSSAKSLTPSAAPQIDDEFLSPAKAAESPAPADDSDEALDAYMASMMERMRSHASPAMSATPEPLPPAPVAVAPAEPAPLDYDPSVPFEIESMKQGRRAPASTDLAALREIANTSARSAIATHRKKRKVESAIGKVIVALTALGTAGFLIWNAPSFQDWQFGSGVAVGLIGLGAAALALRHPDRVAADHRVEAHPAYFTADESAHGDI